MKVILLKDVPTVGRMHDVKNVASGYATNFLIPQGLAVMGTPGALQAAETQRAAAVAQRALEGDLLGKTIENLDGKTFTLKERTNEQGHLFAGVHRAEIIKLLKKETGVILPEEVVVLEEPIKSTGSFPIVLHGAGKQ